MVKKIFYCILCVGLMLSTSVIAEEQVETATEAHQEQTEGGQNTPDESTPPQSPDRQKPQGELYGEAPNQGQQPPQDGFPMDGRGQGGRQHGMGMPPDGMIPPEGMEQIQDGFPFFDGQTNTSDTSDDIENSAEDSIGFSQFWSEYSTPTISMIVLVFGFIFVIFYKRDKF